MCKVSVLIPAYNVENYIRECLDSVFGQTMSDLEVICVDDASTDGTLSILREYAKDRPNLYICCQRENMGQAVGRNLALSHASGEYVYMLDADDKIVPEMLEELYRLCSGERLDVVGFETHPFTEDRNFRENAALPTIVYEDGPVMDGREALIFCMEKETFSLSVPTFMMRRAYLEECGLKFTPGILHEDVGYLFELITRAGRLRFLHKEYFLRRIRAGSTMTSAMTSANIEGYLKSFSRSFDLEPVLRDLYGEDLPFWLAVKKWQRDIFGRLRQLYLLSEDTIYHQRGGHVSEDIRRMFELVKLTAPGRAKAEEILGEEMCSFLQSLPADEEKGAAQVYICGTGQYAERLMDLVGTLDVVIRGILVIEKTRKTFRGFPVYDIREARERSVPVLMGVSHYTREKYDRALSDAGFTRIIRVKF